MTNPTTTRGLWQVVARREMATALRSKSFLISGAVLVVAIVAMIVVSGFLNGRPHDDTVAVVDGTGQRAVEAASGIADRLQEDTTVTADRVADRGAAERAVRSGDADAALLPTRDGYEVVGDDDVDSTLAQALQSAVPATVLSANAADQDVDLAKLQAGTQTTQRLLDAGPEDEGVRTAASYVFVVLFFVTAIGFGMQIATSVTQEKESRVVEILAAAVPIRALLWGKVLGWSVLALAQVVVLGVAATIALVATGQTGALGPIAPALGWYVVFFVLGFVALSSLWAAAGSLASRQQDLQSTTAPAQMLLFVPYIVAFVAGEGVKTVVSMLPIASTMLMPGRLAEGSVPLWQLLVALALTVLAAVLLIRVGARIYERSLLRTGGKLGFGEALRLSDEREPATR
ncbi:hypothetical protein GCM10011519_20650 [Marmoricola endophyticus]|uniref:ABC-2 type transporter transmembrane domain-containing protein n=1 Tax=Marmoricola endophyticus TaxID=2040280 RepID=A0A917F2H1_9ACTN|nr:ABC transporter permease [Marmoricola endophyticus]GGF46550.1 hypothetical protein GCM10011519_20650 [Marmoricola endophyticus]